MQYGEQSGLVRSNVQLERWTISRLNCMAWIVAKEDTHTNTYEPEQDRSEMALKSFSS